MEANYRNKNRGYQRLRVWQDAVDLYVLTCRVFRRWPYELKRAASQAIACSDSVHRNIAEGHCRRFLKEYLYYLNISLGSLGESVSGFIAYHKAEQIAHPDFESLNNLAFRLENGLLKLVESLEKKQETGDWIDHLIIKETNAAYGTSNIPPLHHSMTPSTPTLLP